MISTKDTIRINELSLPLSVDGTEDHLEPILISLLIPHDITRTARSDDLTYSINYASVCSTLAETLPKTHYASLDALTNHIFDALFRSHSEITEATVIVTQRGEETTGMSDVLPANITIETIRRRDELQTSAGAQLFALKGLSLSAIIGVNPHERTGGQPLAFDVTVGRQHRPAWQGPFPFRGLSTSIRDKFGPSEFLTVEALASAVACHVLEYTKDPEDEVTVKISKPMALRLANAAQVQITRRREDFPDIFLSRLPASTSQETSALHSVALALGSNLGDRFANIETALRLLELPRTLLRELADDAKVLVVDTSFMYETAPMYVTDQPRFVNCACMIETNLSPKELLRLVKEIETAVGRVPSIRNGPRVVDLDILTYDDQTIDTRPEDSRNTLDNLIGELVIPHPRICEREFVLRPLNDMIPHFIHPVYKKTIRKLLQDLISAQQNDDFPMLKVIPFPQYPFEGSEASNVHGVQVPPTAKHWTVSSTDRTGKPRPHKAYLMATLNVTPDSFSDGSKHNALPDALNYGATSVTSGADIIDIGGYSTRPGAAYVSPEDETTRVVPVITAIRAHTDTEVQRTLISVDTFRWEVAERAVRAGANCINDVHAFGGPTYPPGPESVAHLAEMRRVARTLGVPVVLMHSRGDAGSNKDYSAYPGGLFEGIRVELGQRVDAIVRGPGGVRRWLVIVDPGIGFSKPVDAQLALLRDLGAITADEPGNLLVGYPQLLGVSKKSLLGVVLEQPDPEGTYKGRKTTAEERGWATAAGVTCAVQQGASVVRVHDVAEMRDVVAVASAIWRR